MKNKLKECLKDAIMTTFIILVFGSLMLLPLDVVLHTYGHTPFPLFSHLILGIFTFICAFLISYFN